MTLVSYPTGNPKLTGYASDTLAYTYGRLAGLAGTADGYDSTKFTEAGAPITKTPGVDNDYLFGGADKLIDKNAKATCPAFDGVWHANGAESPPDRRDRAGFVLSPTPHTQHSRHGLDGFEDRSAAHSCA